MISLDDLKQIAKEIGQEDTEIKKESKSEIKKREKTEVKLEVKEKEKELAKDKAKEIIVNEINKRLMKEEDEITLEYLVNKQYIKGTKERKSNDILKDKQFYKIRIAELTKQLINNDPPEILLSDVGKAFENYARHCIEYFKIIDRCDIIQEDYDSMILAKSHQQATNSSISVEELNKQMMRSIKMKELNSLEKIVTRTVIKSGPPPLPPPVQKEYNLENPALRMKGIVGKKNNISNNYEDSEENGKKKNETKKNEKKK